MTKKQELLLNLEIIKNEHLKWRNYAEARFKGLEINEEYTPVKHTECACGKMILEYGQIIYHFQTAKSIYKDHEEFHKIGKELYEFMKNKEEGNFLTKKAINKKNNEIMNNFAQTLEKLSDSLLRTFDSIRNEINCIDDKKIETMFSNQK